MYQVKVRVASGEHKGRPVIVLVVAETKWQAIDIAYYQRGLKKYEADRDLYEAKRI